MNTILPDYHIHTAFCKHADGDMEAYVKHAIKIGLGEIGFADHMPVMPEPHLCMSYSDLPLYVSKVNELQKRYEGRISIKLGCEMDIVHYRIDEIKDILSTYQFDYVIGSIHYLGDWPFDQDQYMDVFEKEPVETIYERFFDAVVKSVETGLYDIVGHVDNIKRMGYRPAGDLTPHYERVASSIKSMDMAVELNTSGFDRACSEAYPSSDFLNVLNNFGIPVTVGSDSHCPVEVGRYFDDALSELRKAGYDHIVYFKERKRILKPLPSTNNSQQSHWTGMR